MAKRSKAAQPNIRIAPPVNQRPLVSAANVGKQAIVLALLSCGLLAWIMIGAGRGIGVVRWTIIAVGAAIACVPPVARLIGSALDGLRSPTPRARARASMCVALVAAAYLVMTSFAQGRDLFPKTQDDCSYVIGMRMLARGRLWMPPLPLPDFFDAFYILVQPVYCSLYFPGTALLYVAGVWMHLPLWVLPAVASGAAVGLMYRIVAELIDGVAGALAALIMLSLSWFRVYSVLVTSHVPMLLLGLLMVWAWLRWRERRQLRWAALIGVLAGWAAITRPADAVVYALPVGVAVFWGLVRSYGSAGTRTMIAQANPGSRADAARAANLAPLEGQDGGSVARRMLLTPLVIAAAAFPFLTLQVTFDLGVTGHALRAPYAYYLERDQPGSAFGFHPYDAGARPASALPEKREYYDRWVRPYLRAHTLANTPRQWARRWLPMTVDTTMQCRLLLAVVPVGLIGLRDRRRWPLLATLPLFCVIYTLNPFFLEHYAILIIPGVVLLILLGGAALADAFSRVRPSLRAGFATAVVLISVTSFWEVNRYVSTPETGLSDETFISPYLQWINTQLPAEVQSPAIVLFMFPPGGNFIEEPVYNADVAWPDDAPIIRAHDLGEARNRDLYAYYARTQPDRTIYRLNLDPSRHDEPLRLDRLGTARELAAKRP